jgi:aldose 1-epimerase
MIIEYRSFGKTENKLSAGCYTLQNSHGLRAEVSDYGGTWLSMYVPDKDAHFADVLLGFDEIGGYEQNPYVSCITGRFANRIAEGRFLLDEKSYQLEVNDPPNHLHGGSRQGLDKCFWQVEPDEINNSLILRYTSPDGEAGYPGKLDLQVSYQLTEKNEFIIQYHAVTDKATPVNLTNHAYFNLGDDGHILDHRLSLDAARYTPFDASNIPKGHIAHVPDELDFNESKFLGTAISELPERELDEAKKGIDHNLVFDRHDGRVRKQGNLIHLKSGRSMDVYTNEPGIQIYTGQHFQDVLGKEGKRYSAYAGICLETQHFPDSPNHGSFPNTILRPGEVFDSTTIYQFDVKSA